MQAIWEQRFGAVKTLSDVADAMQETILAHSDDLNIGHDRMVSDFHCLWMLLRIRITVDRLPIRAPARQTWLRRPARRFPSAISPSTTATRRSAARCNTGRSSTRACGGFCQ